MAKEYAKAFYTSTAWAQCRESYLKSVGGLCERCLSQGLIIPAKIVHHKERLNEKNIGDPTTTLNFENLEALCQECHNKEHMTGNRKARRYSIGEGGELIF